MKKIRINFEKFSDGILIPQFPWPNDCEIFSVSYGIVETRNGYNSKWSDTNFTVSSYYKVST